MILLEYNRNTTLYNNEFYLLGGSAMIGWGQSDEFDGTKGNFP